MTTSFRHTQPQGSMSQQTPKSASVDCGLCAHSLTQVKIPNRRGPVDEGVSRSIEITRNSVFLFCSPIPPLLSQQETRKSLPILRTSAPSRRFPLEHSYHPLPTMAHILCVSIFGDMQPTVIASFVPCYMFGLVRISTHFSFHSRKYKSLNYEPPHQLALCLLSANQGN
jgi:hypothetical protein